MTSDLAGVEAPKRNGNVAHTVESTPVVVLYEDEALLAVAKPAGLVTHPAYKHPDGTLADAVFARQTARGEDRPWLLHRLDRETSGVVLFAKTEAARRALVRQFECRTIQKGYLAITDGVPSPAEDTVEEPLRRDPADRRRVIADPSGQPAATRLLDAPIHRDARPGPGAAAHRAHAPDPRPPRHARRGHSRRRHLRAARSLAFRRRRADHAARVAAGGRLSQYPRTVRGRGANSA